MNVLNIKTILTKSRALNDDKTDVTDEEMSKTHLPDQTGYTCHEGNSTRSKQVT